MREHEQEFRAHGASLAVIGLGDANYARIFREETGINFPLLIDPDRETYRAATLGRANALHIFRADNMASRKRAKAAGHRQAQLRISHLGTDLFQLGGSFVFGPGNLDRFAHLSKTFGDNASIDSILAALPK